MACKWASSKQWATLVFRVLHLLQETSTAVRAPNHRRPVRELDSSSLYYWDPKLRYGLSDTNITHNLVLSYTYLLPPVVGSTPCEGGRWRLADGGILTIQTGQTVYAPHIGDAIRRRITATRFSYPIGLTTPGCSRSFNPGTFNNYIKIECFAPTKPVVFPGTIG